ncbi:type IX secretion system protein PorG [Chitinophaga nivalis]|uniref:DUF6089 family protein n=1 Tax=Chitinophaga nivalis TaxID=2991709 RepID=A0ABT3IW37_9BACT|nr:DUF6089 family protein [Chitinophaga nivalis]MCW3462118.1 DUF6089 family protein [Chitinophaga nivalis]MCW3488190.1 DUF6089 family protein [Chitinophaga nivalis]
MLKPILYPKYIVVSLLLMAGCLFAGKATAQNELEYVGELGFSVGAAQYFGDLNTRGALNTLKPAVGIYYRKYMNDYVGIRAHGRFMQLGYSDTYNKNEFQKRRNLSFNTNLWELALQGDFSFFRFEPGSLDYRFSPYLTGGASIFTFNPYTYLDGQKYYLQPMRTEGQGTALYPERKPYGKVAYAWVIGGGFKYNLSKTMNIGLEALYRFTQTDYLDDVSTTYAGIAAFPPLPNGQPTVAARLQDRSGATGTPLGVAGRQRGNSRDKDQYITIELTISFLFTAYRCKF